MCSFSIIRVKKQQKKNNEEQQNDEEKQKGNTPLILAPDVLMRNFMPK